MKKRFICLTLASCTILATFTGCEYKGEHSSFSVNFGDSCDSEEIATPDSAQADTETETVETENSDTATVDTTGSEEIDSGDATGGKPWIDSDIKENVTADTVVDPKGDFYLYANKDWILENDIPDGYTLWSYSAKRELDVKKQCMDLLKDESIEGHDAELIRTYRNLVMDWDSRNKLGVSELQGEYDKIRDAKSVDDITKLLTDKETVYDYYNFIRIKSDVGLNDPLTYIAALDSPKLILKDSAEYSERTELGDIYGGITKDLFVYAASKFGMTEEDANKCFDEAIALETKLASHIYTTKEQKSDDIFEKVNNEMSIDDVTALSKKFPLKNLLEALGYVYDGIYLVTNPEYITKLDEIYTDDNLEEIKSLMIVKFITENVGIVDKDTYDKKNELQNQYFGISGALSDEEMAYEYVKEMLPESMQIVYVEKYGSEEDRKKMNDLCHMVIDTYREILSENDWASDEAKNNAIEKLDNMTVNVAYPDKFDDTSGIDIEGCSLIEADKRIRINNIKEDIKKLGTKKDKEKWNEGYPVTDCNAFYSPQDNSINMFIGMMGEPFYSSNMSVEELYASIGAFWVGHEVSHAFDRDGAQFDSKGDFRDWMPEADKAEFQKRIDKMDKYLDTIVAFGDNHFIGSNIDGEMTADITGLQCALKMASKIDGFDYKKFFIKYAQMNANVSTYASELNQISQGEHPLDYSRANVPVQQFQEFYDAFDIKEGDNMYLAPEDRIVVW